MRRFVTILAAGALALAIAAPVAAAKAPAKPGSILDVALAANAPGGAFEGQLSTLITAVLAADPAVAATLDSKGQYTVFAPTNDAFAALPTGTIPSLLANQSALTNVLLYHVAKGARYSGDVVSSSQIRMLNGEFAKITTDGTDYFIDGAKIAIVDIPASNGVIHVITSVMLP